MRDGIRTGLLVVPRIAGTAEKIAGIAGKIYATAVKIDGTAKRISASTEETGIIIAEVLPHGQVGVEETGVAKSIQPDLSKSGSLSCSAAAL